MGPPHLQERWPESSEVAAHVVTDVHAVAEGGFSRNLFRDFPQVFRSFATLLARTSQKGLLRAYRCG